MQNKAIPGFQDGGMQVEPTTGNEVPVGSLPEEVADDVNAKLSPGEFVLPADVVRFIGLERLMKMRDEAKEGLRRMSEIGQMGNAEEAGAGANEEYEDEDFESNIDSILGEMDNEEEGKDDVAQQTEMAFAEGGAVPETTFMGGSDLSKATGNPMVDIRYFKDSKGNTIFVTFINGRPMTPIPEGYTATDRPVEKQVGIEAEKKKEAIKDAVGVGTGGGGVDGGGGQGVTSAATVGGNYGGISAPSGIPGQMAGYAAKGVAGMIGVTNPALAVALGFAGKAIGNALAKSDTVATNNAAIADNLSMAGFSPAAISAAQAAAAQAADSKGATAGSIAAAAAQAAADIDNIDSLDAMMSVTDAFGTAPGGYGGVSSDGGASADAAAAAGYGGSSGDADAAAAGAGPAGPGDYGGDSGYGGYGGDSDGGYGGDSDGGFGGTSGSGNDGGDGDGGDGGWAKGGLIKRRNKSVNPAKPYKGLASRKR